MKYLGVHLDKHLTSESHIKKLINKVSQRTHVLWKICNYIPETLARYLYTTLIHPLYLYCDFIYDGCSITMQNKLQTSQNAALRAVKKCRQDYPVQKLHDDLSIDFFESLSTKVDTKNSL